MAGISQHRWVSVVSICGPAPPVFDFCDCNQGNMYVSSNWQVCDSIIAGALVLTADLVLHMHSAVH
jgi:hypothetical protein